MPARDSRVLRRFLTHFGLDLRAGEPELLGRVAAAFSRLPFENLTKIVRYQEEGAADRARRAPDAVVGDHVTYGTGGTCFALTSAFLHIVRALGWEAQPILADRTYGEDTHSALLVWLDGQPHLLDPGYLIVTPIPIGSAATSTVPTPFNDLVLQPEPGTKRVQLHTVQQGQSKYRLTFKTDPVDAGQFIHAWDASFRADMMRYPVLTRVAGGRHIYFQGNKLYVRDREHVERRVVESGEDVLTIADAFGIDPRLARQALDALAEKGGRRG